MRSPCLSTVVEHKGGRQYFIGISFYIENFSNLNIRFVERNAQWGTGFSEEKPVTAPACQQSVFSESLRASSSSTPRYRIVLSSFECPSKICTALMFFVLA